jgi:hypothetical protein
VKKIPTQPFTQAWIRNTLTTIYTGMDKKLTSNTH